MSDYRIRYNRTTNHIEGLEVRTAGSETVWSLSACGSLTRGGLAVGKAYDTVADALKAAKATRKVCKHCLKAAELQLSAPVPEVPATAPVETETLESYRGRVALRDRWGSLQPA